MTRWTKCPCWGDGSSRGATVALTTLLVWGCGESSSSPGNGEAGAGGSAGASGSAGVGGSAGGGVIDIADAAADAEGGVSGSGGTASISGCPTPAPVAVANQRIAIQSIHFGRSEVVLRNVSDTDQTIVGDEPLGWQWCNIPGYFIITAEDVVLAPGETYKFHLIERTGGTRPLYPGNDPGDVNELVIYDRSGSYTTAAFVLAFVSWGQGGNPQSREPTAVMAGLWTGSERVRITPGHAGLIATGPTDRGAGYTSVPARCLPASP